MNLEMLGTFAGGLGLFLLGMKLMTDGLRLAAGRALRHVLARWTGTPFRALFSGFLVTALVQSSSAVTVATIGFVNAGLLNLFQSVGVVYGSNVGTTVTGWLVASVGFKVDINAIALPLIGGGMVFELVGHGRRHGALGQALAGFGLFFLGIGILKGGFAELGAALPMVELANGGFGVMIFVAVGFLMTLLMQSSSAAMTLTLTAAAGGVVPLELAAAAVIGANVGTTTTAAFAAIGATPNARRVAALHVLFNLATGAVALLILPALLAGIVRVEGALSGGFAVATALAAFHTVFNVLGVAIMWPVTPRLVRWVAQRFRSAEEDAGTPRHLDRTLVGTPHLALDALSHELTRVGGIATDMAKGALSTERVPGQRLTLDRQAVHSLTSAVQEFVGRMQRSDLPEDVGRILTDVLRVARYYGEVAEAACQAASGQADLAYVEDEAIASRMRYFRSDAVALLERADPDGPDYAPAEVGTAFGRLEDDYHELKVQLLRSGVEGRLGVDDMARQLDQYRIIRRLLDQAVKGALYLEGVQAAASRLRDGAVVPAPAPGLQ